jgi:hypothetical protein
MTPTTPFRRALLLAIGAGLLHGSWALYANASTGRGVRAALAQASLSFTGTLTLTLLTEWLFRRAHEKGRTPEQGFAIAAAGTVGVMAAFTISLHSIVGTPHVLLTSGPSLAFGTFFFTSYAWGLRVAARKRSAREQAALPVVAR